MHVLCNAGLFNSSSGITINQRKKWKRQFTKALTITVRYLQKKLKTKKFIHYVNTKTRSFFLFFLLTIVKPHFYFSELTTKTWHFNLNFYAKFS